MAELPGLRVGLALDSATFIAETRKVQASVNQLGANVTQQTTVLTKGFNSASAAVGSFAKGFLAIGSVTALATAARNTLSWADALQEASQRIGIGVEQLQRLQQAGELTNLSQEQITKNLEKFAQKVGDAARGEGKFGDVLKDVGIELRNQDGRVRSVSDLFDEYTARIVNSSSGTEALSLAVAGFSRGGAGFVTTLREMIKAGEEFNALTPEQTEALAKYDDVIGRLSQRLSFEFKETLATTIKEMEALGLISEEVLGTKFANATIVVDELNAKLEESSNILKRYQQAQTQAAAGAGIVQPGALERMNALEQERIGLLNQLKRAAEEAAAGFDILGNAVGGAGDELSELLKTSELGISDREGRLRLAQLDAMQDSEEALKKEMDEQAQASKRAGAEAKRLADTRRKALADLKVEAEQTTRLIAALDQSENQYRAVEIAIEGENRARSLGIDLASDEGRAILEANRALAESTDALARNREEMERRLDVFREMNDEEMGRRMGQSEAGGMSAPDLPEGAKESASETQRIYENAADNIQSAFADAFTNAFEGNITSAQDFADTLKGIFTKTAGEIAAAMIIKPVLAGIGFSPEGGAAGTQGGPAGREWFGAAGSGATFTAPTRPGVGAAAGGAAFGATTGFTVGQTQYGGHAGATVGGTIGGTAGGAAGSFFGPGGAMLGSFAGAQIGSFIGRQFGAGQGQDNKVSFQGQLGIGAGGTGAAAQLVASIDKSIMSLLDATEEGVTNRMLEVARGVSVQYDKEMSANDMASLAAGRIGPAAKALGLDAGRVAVGAPEEQFANLETALGLMRQIEDIELGPMGAELDNLRASFLEAAAAANKFGVDHSDALKEQYRLERQAIGRRFASERIGLEAAFGQRSATSAALAQLKLQFDEAAARAEQLGVSTAGMAAALADAQEEVRAQARAQRAAIITEARGLVGLPETFQSAFKALQQRFAELRSAMEDLGGSTAGLTVLKEKAIVALREERRAQLENIEVQARGLTGLQPTFRQALELLREQFNALRAQTRALGGDLGELTTIQREAQQQLARQQRAEQDAMALSITEPFKQLQDPLLAFGKELSLGTLNPAGQMKAAQDEFRRIARLAQAGSTIAMQQLESAGRAFIEQAGRFGASPALIEANLEVRSAIDAVSADLAAAQKAASRGVEDAIDKASRREVDTLREMIKEVQLVADEIKRLGRK